MSEQVNDRRGRVPRQAPGYMREGSIKPHLRQLLGNLVRYAMKEIRFLRHNKEIVAVITKDPDSGGPSRFLVGRASVRQVTRSHGALMKNCRRPENKLAVGVGT